MEKIKVIVASGSPMFGRSLSRAIEQADHDVVRVRDGQGVIEALEKHKIDVCFVQDALSDCSGLEICEQISRSTDGVQIPIIVFSRDAMVENLALEKGASGFLKVPSLPKAITELVNKWSHMALRKTQDPAIADDGEHGDVSDEIIAESQEARSPADSDTFREPVAENEDQAPLILLVDDSKVIHRYVGDILKEYHYRLIQAYDGVEGFEKAMQSHPDLIISDLDMPNMNGFEMCRRIKEVEETQNIPILILSARGAGVDIDKGFDVGANDFLTKPVVENELISRIEIILGGENAAEKREKILVVEDSALQRNVIIQGLAQQGFDVVSGNDGEEGLKLAIEHEPDLVITDSEMPVMNGRDLTRALRKHDGLKDVPILMLTAADSPLNRAKGKHAGVSSYLTKPFVPDKVVVIAEKLIGERRMVRERQALQHYVSDSAMKAASAAAETRGDVQDVMRAEEKFMTIYFSDIVGFTPLTERMDPRDLVHLLNDYFDAVAPLFKNNGGIIDKFVGDAIMALFVGEDEASRQSSAYNAVKTGMEMLDALKTLNAGREDTINVRVGINSGSVIMGDIGSKIYRRDFTVIGDNVNVAARLESAAEHGSVLISDSTYQFVRDRVEVTSTGPIEVKGKSEPIVVYQVDRLV